MAATEQNFFKHVENFGELPRNQIENFIGVENNYDFLDSFKTRDKFTKLFGWSIPCKEAVDLIKKFAREPLYDLMAGTGYWARILNKAGIDVRASDIHKIISKNHYHKSNKTNYIKNKRTKIRRKNAIKIAYDIGRKRINGDVFLSGPPYQSCTPTYILEYLPLNTRFFYIGEGYGGCTGDASLYLYLEKNFSLLAEENLPNFFGIHDYLSIHEKISNTK